MTSPNTSIPWGKLRGDGDMNCPTTFCSLWCYLTTVGFWFFPRRSHASVSPNVVVGTPKRIERPSLLWSSTQCCPDLGHVPLAHLCLPTPSFWALSVTLLIMSTWAWWKPPLCFEPLGSGACHIFNVLKWCWSSVLLGSVERFSCWSWNRLLR